MVLDGTTPNEDSMVSGEDGQAFTSPQIVDPKRMNKLLRYLLRRGMYTSVIPSVLYRALLVMREYNSASEWGRRQTFHRQVQADLVVCTFQDCVDN